MYKVYVLWIKKLLSNYFWSLQIFYENLWFVFKEKPNRQFFYIYIYIKSRASLVAQTVKNLPAVQETQVWSAVRKIPWRRKRQPTPVSLPGKSHGQRSLVGYSPWACQGLDMTDWLTLSYNQNLPPPGILWRYPKDPEIKVSKFLWWVKKCLKHQNHF